MAQSSEQKDFVDKLAHQNEFNAFCVDCQKNRSTHANISFGTFICGDCAIVHSANFPQMQSYVKSLEEVWDPYQLRVIQIGGNKPFYEFLRDYQKEREDIIKKYKTDAATYYRKAIAFRAKNVPFEDKAPPKNAQEMAERAAEETARVARDGWSKTASFANDADEKYKIKEKTSEAWTKTRTSFMGLFGGSSNNAGQQQ